MRGLPGLEQCTRAVRVQDMSRLQSPKYHSGKCGLPADGNSSRSWFLMGPVVSEYVTPTLFKNSAGQGDHPACAPCKSQDATRSDKDSGAHRDLSGCGTTVLGGSGSLTNFLRPDPAAMALGVLYLERDRRLANAERGDFRHFRLNAISGAFVEQKYLYTYYYLYMIPLI